MMMMMADAATSGIQFGQVPNQLTRPLISVPRQQTAGFDVSKVPNGFTGQVVGQITAKEIPFAFGGVASNPATGGGNTLLAAQIQSTVAPRQATFGASTPSQYKFGANTTAESYVTEKGSANVAKDSALASGGASGDVVTKAGAAYTG
jgi:hypothetical protein